MSGGFFPANNFANYTTEVDWSGVQMRKYTVCEALVLDENDGGIPDERLLLPSLRGHFRPDKS